MKAIVYTEYGPPDVLHLEEVEKPNPKDHEILVRVHAASVGYGDLLARDFKADKFNMPLPLLLLTRLYFGLSRPKVHILGSEFAGEVEAIGKDVKRFHAGDPVFGYLGQRMGAYAEYVCMPEDGPVALKPANLTYAEAAVIPYGAIMASSLLRKAGLQPGQKVLVNGASGGIGSMAVQLAKYFGAQVTGVCGAPRVAFVKALGADQVIDYTREDFTRNGETYDLILDILGKASFSRCKGSLKPDGTVLYASFKMKHLLQMLWTSLAGGKKVICTLAAEKAEDLATIKELIEAGKVKAVVDRCYPMEQAAEAHRYVEQGHKKGHVVMVTF